VRCWGAKPIGTYRGGKEFRQYTKKTVIEGMTAKKGNLMALLVEKRLDRGINANPGRSGMA